MKALLDYLNKEESVAESCVLVKTYYVGMDLDDSEVFHIYSRPDSVNLSERDEMLSKLTESQKVELYEVLLDTKDARKWYQ